MTRSAVQVCPAGGSAYIDKTGSILLELVRLALPAPDPETYDQSSDMWAAVFCAEGVFPCNADLRPALVRLFELVAPTFSDYEWYSTPQHPEQDRFRSTRFVKPPL